MAREDTTTKGVEQVSPEAVEAMFKFRKADDVAPDWNETIVAAACRYGRLVLTVQRPGRHANIFQQYAHQFEKYLPISRHPGGSPEEQGFLTNTGRFVTREAAWRIAVLAKQPFLRKNDGGTLYSEDLW